MSVFTVSLSARYKQTELIFRGMTGVVFPSLSVLLQVRDTGGVFVQLLWAIKLLLHTCSQKRWGVHSHTLQHYGIYHVCSPLYTVMTQKGCHLYQRTKPEWEQPVLPTLCLLRTHSKCWGGFGDAAAQISQAEIKTCTHQVSSVRGNKFHVQVLLDTLWCESWREAAVTVCNYSFSYTD